MKGYSHLFPRGLAGRFAPNDGGLWDTDDGAVHGHSTTNSHHLVVRFDVKSRLNWKIEHRTHFMHLEKKGLLVKQRNIIIMYGHMNMLFIKYDLLTEMNYKIIDNLQTEMLD